MNNEERKRTTWDFTEHTHTVEIFKNGEKEIRVDHLQKGNSSMGYVRFTNDDRTLTVTGDFGNWVFCRPFHPSHDGFVSVGYWNEKLKIHSEQDHAKYDGDETRKEINTLLSSGLKDYGYEGEELHNAKVWYRSLLDYVDDEIDYTYHAFRSYDMPDFIDHESIPFEKKEAIDY